jgi:hypothetical protein
MTNSKKIIAVKYYLYKIFYLFKKIINKKNSKKNNGYIY